MISFRALPHSFVLGIYNQSTVWSLRTTAAFTSRELVAAMPQPELPEPAHVEVDSMLSRKFGKEVANYFSGSFSPQRRAKFGSSFA